jgi:hypothetical protein
LCLKILQSLPVGTSPASWPGAEAAELTTALLAALGMETLAYRPGCPGSSDGAALVFDLAFEPVGASYSGLGTCYNGSASTGTLTLELDGAPALSIPVAGRKETSILMTEKACKKTPGEAPFSDSWQGAVLEGLAATWGLPPLVAALRLPGDWQLHESAAEALEERGPTALPAVPALLECLEHAEFNTGWMQSATLRRALIAITGRDYQLDLAAWKSWWDANRP